METHPFYRMICPNISALIRLVSVTQMETSLCFLATSGLSLSLCQHCMMVFMPHFSNVAQQCLYGCKRCCDRGCSCDDRRTSKLVQEDYENINTGNEFMLEFRYSNMLTVISVSFLYSGGMPFLYPVAALFFFFTYWVDKCLLFNYYRKPI